MDKRAVYRMKKTVRVRKPSLNTQFQVFEKGELVREEEENGYGFVKFCSVRNSLKHLWIDRPEVSKLVDVV